MKALYEILKKNFAVDEEGGIEPPSSCCPSTCDESDRNPEFAPKHAYDHEEPIKQAQEKTLSYDPRNRQSMETALNKMSSEISNAWKNIDIICEEIETLARELGIDWHP